MISMLRARLAVVALGVLLSGCASIPEPAATTSTPDGLALFERTVVAHGRDALAAIDDIAVSYDGEWFRLVQSLQGVLVDPDYRKQSEERLLLDVGMLAQVHQGPAGRKFVRRVRRFDEPDSPSGIAVRYDGRLDSNTEVLDAAALVADAYRMFLLGPLHFLDSGAQFETLEPVTLDGRATDRLRIRAQPGTGRSEQDDYVLYIDREDSLVRRIRFTLEGLASTRGAIVETDLSDYIERGGVQFPTQFFERIRRPIPRLSAHRWRMTGLDLNRGLRIADVAGGRFTGSAAAPAAALPVDGS